MLFHRSVHLQITQRLLHHPSHIRWRTALGQIEIRTLSNAVQRFLKVIDIEKQDDLGAGALSRHKGHQICRGFIRNAQIQHQHLILTPPNLAKHPFGVMTAFHLSTLRLQEMRKSRRIITVITGDEDVGGFYGLIHARNSLLRHLMVSE